MANRLGLEPRRDGNFDGLILFQAGLAQQMFVERSDHYHDFIAALLQDLDGALIDSCAANASFLRPGASNRV